MIELGLVNNAVLQGGNQSGLPPSLLQGGNLSGPAALPAGAGVVLATCSVIYKPKKLLEHNLEVI